MKKTVVVTGGTRGIGREVSLQYLNKGYKVFALYARNTDEAKILEDLAKDLPGECVLLRGDLTQSEVMDSLSTKILEESEVITDFVHCAASGVHKSVDKLRTKHLKWTFEINVFAFHELFLRLLPKMTQGSKIIGLTSAGSKKYLSHYAAVGSSKGALDALFRHYAVELAPKGISVYLVCPGMVETEALKAFPDRDNRLQAVKDTTPTGRLTTSDDVAKFIMYLSDLDHCQFTGETFSLDGGRSLIA
jgi:enoyl-[acyl-carrier protein] reductase III